MAACFHQGNLGHTAWTSECHVPKSFHERFDGLSLFACDRIVAEHNQAELNKLECTDSKQYLTLERLASLLGQLGLKCE